MGYGISLKVSIVDVYCYFVRGLVDFCHPALDICAVQEIYLYVMKQNFRKYPRADRYVAFRPLCNVFFKQMTLSTRVWLCYNASARVFLRQIGLMKNSNSFKNAERRYPRCVVSHVLTLRTRVTDTWRLQEG